MKEEIKNKSEEVNNIYEGSIHNKKRGTKFRKRINCWLGERDCSYRQNEIIGWMDSNGGKQNQCPSIKIIYYQTKLNQSKIIRNRGQEQFQQ